MKKRFLTFFCTMAVLLFSQSAWAAQGEATINKLSRSNARLNSIVGNNYEYTTEDGFMKVVITGEHAVAYSTESDACQDVAKLTFGHVKGNEKFNFKFQVSKPGAGYELTLISARTLTKMVGTYGYYALGNHNEELINNTAGAWTDQKATYTALTTEVPFYFRGGSARIGGNLGVGACMEKYELEYLVVPNAPTWNPEAADVKVTVNHTQDAYLHWIDLSSYIQVANDAFKGTVKYEAVGLDAKYIIWSADSTKCYIIKPGTYEFRAYIDKKDGVYCSSAYTATNLQLTATADAAEQANAQIFYMVDDKLVNEIDKTNHVWEVNLAGPSQNHWVEYIYAFDGDLLFEQQTSAGIQYLVKTENRKDNFNVLSIGGKDSTIVTNADQGARSWLRINSVKADNHVTFTINSEPMYNALMTSVSHQEGNDVFWDNNRIRFAHFNNDYSRKRTLEITFLGVPDSLIMLYGNNSEQQSSNTHLSIEYYDGAWHDFTMINGRPDGSSVDKAKRFAYQLPASASKLRFAYWGAQNLGFIHDLTVTERKGFTMSVAMDSVLFFSGRHQIGGKTEAKNLKLNWYNLYPALHDTLVESATLGFAPEMFTRAMSGVNPLALDAYQENIPVMMSMKLDSVGSFETRYMVWNGKADMSEVPGGKKVYGFTVKGVVGFNKDELILENNLPDTTLLKQDSTLTNPFILKDTLGNEVTPKDSIKLEYTIIPENAAEIDENGNITAKCVGLTTIIATSKENLLIPGGVKDTLLIYTPEKEANKIVLNIPTEIGLGDVLDNLATTDDGAEMTYEFVPADAAQQIAGKNQIKIGNQVGTIAVKATAAQTCDHFKVDTLFSIYAMHVLNPKDIKEKDPKTLENLHVGDSIVDLVVVTNDNGDTLRTPDIKIEYIILPEGKITTKDSLLILDHAGDPIQVVAKITGDTIKTKYDTIYLSVKPWNEKVWFVNMPDTLFIGHDYDLATYTATQSGHVINKAELSLNFGFASFNGLIMTPEKANMGNKLTITADGDDDYTGPAYADKVLYFVKAVKDIPWEEKLKDLDDKHKGDTIPVNDVPVLDEDSNDITNQITKTYEFLPDGTYAHLDEETQNVVIDKAGEIYMIITTSGFGFETKRDTVLIQSAGYIVDSVALPGAALLDQLHVGDTLSMQGAAKVFDIKGKDISNKVDTIIYTIEPSDAAHFDENGDLVIDKDMEFDIICAIYGDELIPDPSYDTIHVDVNTYENLQVIFPDDDLLQGLRPGDMIPAPAVKILDENGKDITELCDIKYTFEPDSAAHVDENGNIIIDNAGDLKIKTEITGEGIQPTQDEKDTHINPYEVGEIILPELGDEFHVGDVLDMTGVQVKDVDGNDITDYAEITYTFEPADGAHVDKDGNIVIDKSGNLKIVANVGGTNVAPASDDVEIFVKKYKTNEIIIPEKPADDYEVGEKLPFNEIKIIDEDGKDITNDAVITITWIPEDAAHQDSKGNLIFDKPGKITVTTCVGGEGVTEKCVENTYIIRHDESDCKNLLAQVWDDVLTVNNNQEQHVKMGLPQFVSYQWYREEELLVGETNQDYHLSAEEFKDSANFYVRAIGTDGKEYLICGMWVNENNQPAASQSFKVYPTVISTADTYTVEVTQAGTVFVTTSNGSAMGSYPVAAGMNSVDAPASNGVYVLQFVPNDGQYEVQKLIVK